MADLEKGIFFPKIDIASVSTKRDLNDPNITLALKEPVYLMKYPYVDKLLDPTTVILFLCSLKFDEFVYEFRYNLARIIDGNLCNCRIIIREKPEGYRRQSRKKSKQKKSDDEKDQTEKPQLKKIFKLLFDSQGNFFYIQILGTSDKVKYELIKFKRKYGTRPLFLYTYNFIYDPSLSTPYQIKYPKEVFKKLSILFNNKAADIKRNQFTSILFYRFSPFHCKTISRNKFHIMNPCNDLYAIFNRFSGFFLYSEGDGPFLFKGKSVSAFAWLHPFFHEVVSKASTIGLDATFRVLKPFKVCIPQCIIQNTGVPLGILVASQESFKLYSLLFELLIKIDPSGNLTKEFQEKSYITDEHSCFNKLKRVYNLRIYKCFTHLIRSVGSSSVLGLLLRDLLFSFTLDDFNADQLKNAHLLKQLYDNDPKKNEARYTKVAKVLGIDVKGQPCEIDDSYSPLFIRSERNVPTTNNYSEAYHSKINAIAGNFKISINNRLALLVNHIMQRIQNVDQSSIANLRTYMRYIKSKALEKVERSPELLAHYSKDKCNCKRSQYYSFLYGITIPCIHQILNEVWNEIDITEFLINISIKDVKINYANDDLLNYFELEKKEEDEEEDIQDEEETCFPFDNIFIQETKFYDNPVQRMIYHMYKHMKRICVIDKIEVSSILVDIQQKLLDDAQTRKKLNENYAEYLAILQIKTLEEIYRQKGISDKFY